MIYFEAANAGDSGIQMCGSREEADKLIAKIKAGRA